MSAEQKCGVRPLSFLASILLAVGAYAAPDEELLGKAEGYPICPGSARPEARCLVGLVSRFDEVFPARKVARGTAVRPLKRVAADPVIRYTYESHGESTWRTTCRAIARRVC